MMLAMGAACPMSPSFWAEQPKVEYRLEQAIAFMEEFDKVIVQHLESECKVKTKLTGVLGSYRHFDDVYYMFAKNVTAEFTFANKPDKETITVDRLKLLMCKNAKLNDALK